MTSTGGTDGDAGEKGKEAGTADVPPGSLDRAGASRMLTSPSRTLPRFNPIFPLGFLSPSPISVPLLSPFFPPSNPHPPPAPPPRPQAIRGSYRAIVMAFAVLGWTAFGGPSAHIAQFHKDFDFVELRGWMSDDVFAELLALCQTVPGPSSTQMSFAIGILQKGISGGLLSGILFQYPGLIIMSLAGFGAAKFLVDPGVWLTAISAGLAAVAVALVAEAAVVLGKKVCKDRVSKVLCMAAAVITFYYQTQWLFPTIILVGGLITVIIGRNKPIAPARSDIERLGVNRWGGALLIFVWGALLVTSIVVKNAVPYEDAQWMHWFEGFYVTGSVTYGGGQVVLPLLENVVVHYDCPNNGSACTESPNTWVTQQQFMAGLALAQAMPGPLFNFSAYLGAIIGKFGGIAACWLGLFSPGILLIYGILPFWGRFRQWHIYKRATPGFNSTAIGLIWASVFTLGLQTYSRSPFPMASLCIAMIGYAATNFLKIPAPLAIIGGGALGAVAWATHMH
ncbi:unnamed protein product [Closterium sp. Naga37s-1]|nr:unnamed protein product [Closterium sp. Naga37s-1]